MPKLLKRLDLTNAEIDGVLTALSEILDGNARDIDELRKCGYSPGQIEAMERAEAKLLVARHGAAKPKGGSGGVSAAA